MKKSVLFMTQAGVIAALYAALTLCLSPISFGIFQCRISEALVVLAAFTPAAIPGLTLGCLISNAIGLAMGVNIAGAWDILFGTLATLLASLCSYALRQIRFFKLPILSTLPPVIFNAVIIGAELSYVLNIPLWFCMLVEVGIGEAIACCIIGALLCFCIIKFGLEKYINQMIN